MSHIRGFLLLGALVVATFPLAAQKNGAPRPGRAALVRDIDQLFLTRVTRDMALTDEQTPRFQKVLTTWAQKRAALEAEERRLVQARNFELRPGVAGNQDSLSRFVDALAANRVAQAESFRDEMKELSPILSPVQRGQFQRARDQLIQQIRDIQQQRPNGGPLRN